jgi:hypothetical protein
MMSLLTSRSMLVSAALLSFGWTAQAADTDAEIILNRNNQAKEVVSAFDIRPNTKQSFFISLKNNALIPKTYTVVVQGLPGTPLALRESITLNRSETKIVAWKPPAPVEPKKVLPKSEPKADAKEAKKDEPKPEPPPGVELIPAKVTDQDAALSHAFRVNVLDDEGKPAAKEKTVYVSIQSPSVYIDEPIVSTIETGKGRGIKAIVKAKSRKENDVTKEAAIVPPSHVALIFPPQLGLKTSALRAGSYQRSLGLTGQSVELTATDLPTVGPDGIVKFHINVDGYARAFTYAPDISREIFRDETKNRDTRLRDPGVRLIPLNGTPREITALSARALSNPNDHLVAYSLPNPALRFLVEVENEPSQATLLIKVDRSGRRDFRDPDEVINLGRPRDEHVYVDFGGPEGSIGVANSVSDRIASVDVSALRGLKEVQAVLIDSKQQEIASFVIDLHVDDTAPPLEEVLFGKFPKRLVKGKTLPVSLTADDAESGIARVDFVLGKPGPDGKIPPEAPRTPAIKTVAGWTADVPVPTDKKAPLEITAEVENEVGLKSVKTVRIELVDPPKGSIEGIVERGGRPQPEVPVTLRDAKGEVKGVAKTNAQGKYLFENVDPGAYRVIAAKPDAGAGTAGASSVQVQPNVTKAVTADITLQRK